MKYYRCRVEIGGVRIVHLFANTIRIIVLFDHMHSHDTFSFFNQLYRFGFRNRRPTIILQSEAVLSAKNKTSDSS